MEKFGEILIRYRLGFLAGVLALAGLLASFIFPLSELRYDFSARRIFEGDEARVSLLHEFKETFGDDVGWIGVLYTMPEGEPAPAIADPRVLASMARVSGFLRARPELQDTISPLDLADLHGPTIQARALGRLLPGDPSGPEMARLIQDFEHENRAGLLEEVRASVISLASHGIYQGRIISKSGDAAAVLGRFDDQHLDDKTRVPTIDALEAVMMQEREALVGVADLDLMGLPVVTRSLTRTAQADTAFFIPIVFLTIAVLLYFFFRSLAGTLVALAAVLLSMLAGVGLMQAAGQTINLINNTIPTIILVVGIAEAIHLMERYQSELTTGLDRKAAMARAGGRMLIPCLLSMVTTAVGFASLVSARIPVIQSYGLYTGLAVLVAAVVNLTFVPSALSFVDIRRRRPARTARSIRTLAWIAELTIRYRRRVLLGSLVLTGTVAVLGLVFIQKNARMLEETAEDDPVRVSMEKMQDRMAGILTHEVYIRARVRPESSCTRASDCRTPGCNPAACEAPGCCDTGVCLTSEQGPGTCAESIRDPGLLAAMARVDEELMRDPDLVGYLDRVDTLADLVREAAAGFSRGNPETVTLPESRNQLAQLLLMLEGGGEDELARFQSFEQDRTRMSLLVKDRGLIAWAGLEPKLQSLLDRELRNNPGLKDRFEVQVTGTMTYVNETLDFIIVDMMTSVGLAFVIIALLISILFRSLRVGLVSMIPNIFPLVCTLGLMAAAGIYLRVATLIIFAICLGMAVDDTIHFLARFRQEIRNGRTPEDAIRETMTTTGRAMAITTVILIAGFLINLTSGFMAMRQFGFLSGFTLLTALLGDYFILSPCILIFKLERAFLPRTPAPGPGPSPRKY